VGSPFPTLRSGGQRESSVGGGGEKRGLLWSSRQRVGLDGVAGSGTKAMESLEKKRPPSGEKKERDKFPIERGRSLTS